MEKKGWWIALLNRLNDKLVKTVFGNNQHRQVSLSLINAIFEFEGTQTLCDIEFIDREIPPQYQFGKESRLDFLGKTIDGTKVNIEFQVNNEGNIEKRSMYYWSRLYNDLESGEDYLKLSRTVAINILDFKAFSCEEYHSCYGVYNIKNKHQLTTDVELHFLEIPKWQLKNVKEMNRLERWMAYFSKKINEKELEEISMLEPAIRSALEIESVFTKDERARYEYEMEEKARRDYLSAMLHRERVGVEKGIEQGMRQGMQQGVQQGIKETAIKMLRKNQYTTEEISDITGLSMEKINLLKKEI